MAPRIAKRHVKTRGPYNTYGYHSNVAWTPMTMLVPMAYQPDITTRPSSQANAGHQDMQHADELQQKLTAAKLCALPRWALIHVADNWYDGKFSVVQLAQEPTTTLWKLVFLATGLAEGAELQLGADYTLLALQHMGRELLRIERDSVDADLANVSALAGEAGVRQTII